MKQKLVSLRVQEDEFEALKVLARREIRSISSWVRARIVMEAQAAGLIATIEDLQADKPRTGVEAK